MKSIYYTTMILSLCGAFLFLQPLAVDAAVMRSGERVSVSNDQIVPGDFYAAGNDVYIAGLIEGDAYVLGGTVALKGTVKGDVVVVGGTVVIDGDVGGAVRVLGGKVTVSEKVGKDVAVVGGALVAPSTSHVVGDILFYGADLHTEGVVEGSIIATAQTIKIDGSVKTIDVVVAQELRLDAHAQIKNDVTYQSSNDIVRAPESVVGGSVHKQEVQTAASNPAKGMLPLVFMTLFSSLVAVLIFKNGLENLFRTRGNALGTAGAIGLGAFVGIPVAVVLLCVTVLGIPLGIVLFCAYLMLCMVVAIIIPIFIGAYAAKLYQKEYAVTWAWTAGGVVALYAVLLVPVIGPVIVGVLGLVVLGMLVHQLYARFRTRYG